MRTVLWFACLFCIACSPAVISRIGPPVPPRDTECDIEILSEGETPLRPFRNVGIVSLKNCQDYQVDPCRRWLVKAACELGGHVVYRTEAQNLRDGRQDGDAGPVTYRVMVGAYVSEMIPDADLDPVLNSTEIGCDEVVEPAPDTPAPDRCME